MQDVCVNLTWQPVKQILINSFQTRHSPVTHHKLQVREREENRRKPRSHSHCLQVEGFFL